MIGVIWPVKVGALRAERLQTEREVSPPTGTGAPFGGFPVNHHPPPCRSEMMPFQSVAGNPLVSLPLELHSQQGGFDPFGHLCYTDHT